MAEFEEHCDDCRNALGEPFAEVHQWLDELFKFCGSDHRDIRHNEKGVEKIRDMAGSKAAKAAEIHIIKDCGRVPKVDKAFELQMALKPHIYEAFLKEYTEAPPDTASVLPESAKVVPIQSEPVKLPPITVEELNTDSLTVIPRDVLQLQVDTINVVEGRVELSTFPPDYQNKIQNYYRFAPLTPQSQKGAIAQKSAQRVGKG